MLRTLPLLTLVALLAAPAAAEENEARWRIAAGARLRYDLEAPPAPAGAPSARPLLLLGPESFRAGRAPSFAVGDVGDLLWYFALALPEGAGEEGEVAERFQVRGGALTATGRWARKQRGGRLSLQWTLELASTVKDDPLQVGGGARLLVASAFDVKKGLLREARLQLGVGAAPPWTARIAPGQLLDLAGRGLHAEVEAAIERGARWLYQATKQRVAAYKAVAPGQALGRVALPTFALLRSGLPFEDVAPFYAWMEQQELRETYSVSLWIMALEALSVERERVAAAEGTRSVARFRRGAVAPRRREQIARAVAWLLAASKGGWWDYTAEAGRGDRSNSQFAVLALHSAAASGVEVPRAAWEAVLKEALAHQEHGGPPVSGLARSVFAASSPLAGEGERAGQGEAVAEGTRVRAGDAGETAAAPRARGWAYAQARRAADGSAYGSMTAAGVSTVAVASEALRAGGSAAGPRGATEALRDGLAWLLHRFDPAANPGRGQDHYFYYLYSLEKALDTAGVDRLGEREWYREVAAELLARQGKDGSWGGVEDSALALLVLNRATLPARLEIEAIGPVATGEPAADAWDQVALEGVGRLGVQALLHAMAAAPAEAARRLELARRALEALLPEQRPRLAADLAELLASEHKGARRWAARTCQELTGSDEPAAVRAFGARYERLVAAQESGHPGAIPAVREALADARAPRSLKRQALLAAGRLGAVEAIPEVLEQLLDGELEQRQVAIGTLIGLAGGKVRPFEAAASAAERERQVAAWQGWWREAGGARVAEVLLARAVADLGRPDRAEQGASVLRARRSEAVRPLVDGLRDEATRAGAHALLVELTGAQLPPEVAPWLAWLERPAERLAARAEPAKPSAPAPSEAVAGEPAPAPDSTTAPAPAEDEPPGPPPDQPAPAAPPTSAGWGLVPRPSQR